MTTETIVIRPASLADAPTLAWFAATTFMATYAGKVSDDDLIGYVGPAFTSARMTAEIENHHVLVAEADRAMIGYALLREGNIPGFVPGDHPIELGRLYVASTAQRNGIGTRLFTATLAHAAAQGHDTIWLTVWERNPGAIAAYQRWSFATVGSVTFPFGTEVHRDLVMARRVTP